VFSESGRRDGLDVPAVSSALLRRPQEGARAEVETMIRAEDRTVGDEAYPDNLEVLNMLRQRAKKKGRALTWNRNSLLASYAVLTATIVVALRVQNELVIAPTAVFGLVLIWAFNSLHAKKVEADNLENEIDDYQELLSKLQRIPEQAEPASPDVRVVASPLSGREVEVLNEIASGKSNKQAAVDLFISEQTVKNHIKHIFTKLEVGDRTSAILLAVRNGWVEKDRLASWRKPWTSNDYDEPEAR
jgi:ATP/maltotriose-dependent transcriptional regulator MalT